MTREELLKIAYQKAIEYVNPPCGMKCWNCESDTMSCRFFNDVFSFRDGWVQGYKCVHRESNFSKDS